MNPDSTLLQLKAIFNEFKNRLQVKNALITLLLFGFVHLGNSQISNPTSKTGYYIYPITVDVCFVDIGNGLNSATFSYNNPNNDEIIVGNNDSYLIYSSDNRRVNVLTEFNIGTEDKAFTVEFTSDETVKWTVITNGNERSITANVNCNVCSSEENGVIFPVYDQGNGKNADVLGTELTALATGKAGTNPSNLIFQVNADNKVFVEIIPQPGQLQAVLDLLTTTYDLQYNSNAVISDFAVDPTNIISETLPSIDVFFPISQLLELNNFSQIINFVRPLYPPSSNAGIVTSQGDGAQMSDIVRESFKLVRNDESVFVDGTGVKIGVISDSFDTQPFTGNSKATVDVENGDLPGVGNPNGYTTPVDIIKDYPFGAASDEGRAMLQIVHDVAPGAELAFHTGIISPRDFEIGIKQLKDAGCTVIVDDITFPLEPFFGDGRIATAIKEFSLIPGNSYVTSAGNFADNGYQGGFVSSANIPSTNFITSDSQARAHVFGLNPDGSDDVFQKISVVPGTYMIVLQWDENQASQENSQGAIDDLDIYLVDDQGRLIVGNNRVNEAGDPTEIIVFQSTGIGEANILITSANGPPPANLPFRYIAFQSNGLEIEEYAGAPTVSGHAMTTEAITVAAIDYRVAQNPSSQKFSSYGGTLPNTALLEIDFSAPDGVNTNVGSIGQDIEGDGFTNFFGTSASAPHAAAALALLESAAISWYPDGLPIVALDLFKQTAIPFGTTDRAGAGLINTAAAFKEIAAQTGLLSDLIIEEGKTPSAEPFEVTIVGDYFPENPKVVFGGEELEILSSTQTEIKATVNSFVGNPPLVVNTTPITPSGADGGDSNPLYFFDGKIALNVKADDVDVLFGDAVEFSFSVEGLEDGVTFESLGLPPIVFTSPAVFPYPDVNNYIITPEFETPLTEEQLEAYQINFVNGILNVTKKDLVIKPVDLMYTYGDAINVVLDFSYDTAGIEDDVDFLANLRGSYETSFFPDNTLALVNRFKAVVNEYEILNLLNGGSWMSSERTIQNRFKAVVNGMNIVDLDVDNFTDYIDANSDVTTNRFKAVVNRFKAVVNGEDLFNGMVDLGIENQFKAVVNDSDLGGDTDLNDYAMVFAILDEEDAPTDTEDRTISKFYSLNLITGLDVTSVEEHYIFPGAFLAPIAANFNITYESGRLIILPAALQVSTSDLEINEGESIDTSLIQSTITGLEYDDTIETVFPDEIPYLFVNSDGNEYEIGDTGVFDIKIREPANYTIVYTSIGKLNVVKANELEYCDSKQKKVYICHNGKTICVSINAIDSHLNNHSGDHLGQCTDEHGNVHDDNNDDDSESSYKIYPNPVYNVLKIEPTVQRKITVEIFNIYGVTYYHKIFKKKKSKQVNINMSSYPKGLYIVKITNDSKEDTYNIVKN